MMKVKAVAPYRRDNNCNFKYQPYEAWRNLVGNIARASYPPRRFLSIAYRLEIPFVLKKKEARLRFVEACSLRFDTFPDYAFYEIIPLIWDAWPQYDDIVVEWFIKHHVKTCILTSSQAATRLKCLLPQLNVLTITEGINVNSYIGGEELSNRSIHVFFYGRVPNELYRIQNENEYNVVISPPFEEFYNDLQNSMITIAVAKEIEGQETLTQRFWEGMLSRMVIIGKSPKELTNLIGYDPVIPIDYDNFPNQVKSILDHIEDYQELVDKNRETALRMAPWEIRMNQVMDWLESLGYQVR